MVSSGRNFACALLDNGQLDALVEPMKAQWAMVH